MVYLLAFSLQKIKIKNQQQKQKTTRVWISNLCKTWYIFITKFIYLTKINYTTFAKCAKNETNWGLQSRKNSVENNP